MVSASTARFYDARPNGFQRFGAPRDGGGRKHRGTDFSHSSRPGTPVPALLGGTVTGKRKPGAGHGFGFQVTTRVVFAGRTWEVSYAHGHRTSPFKVGDAVKQGDVISTEGVTGATQGPCMHMEVFDVGAGRFVDPMKLVAKVLAGGGGGSPAVLGTSYARRAPRLKRNLVVDGAWGRNEVRAMRQWLSERWNYSGGVDGVPGPGTKAAFGRAEKGNAEAFAAVG